MSFQEALEVGLCHIPATTSVELVQGIGGVLFGPWMRFTILASIVLSQVGFVAAYTIFVAENLRVETFPGLAWLLTQSPFRPL